MKYDLNFVLDPENNQKKHTDHVSTVFDNVTSYKFQDNFDYLKVAVDYLYEFGLPCFYNDDSGISYHDEFQIKNFLNYLMFFEVFSDQNTKYKINRLMIHTVKNDKNLDLSNFILTTTNQAGFEQNIDSFIYDYKILPDIYYKLAQELLFKKYPSEQFPVENDLNSYKNYFEKNSIKEPFKYFKVNQPKEDRVKSILEVNYYMNFFLDFPEQFEEFRVTKKLPPEISCIKYLANFNKILLKLDSTHLDILKSRENNSDFESFVINCIWRTTDQNSFEQNSYLIRHMFKNIEGWNSFFKSEILFPENGIKGFLKNLDKKLESPQKYSYLLNELLKLELEIKFPDKEYQARQKI